MLSRKANAVAELPADFRMMSRGMQTLIEVLGRTAMQGSSMTMIHQRATKISLTGIKKRRDQGVSSRSELYRDRDSRSETW